MWTTRGTGRSARNAAGYTVVELMMGMAISGIMTAVSMPSMLDTIQRYRADAAPRQVMADLRFAQSHAISRGMQARLVIFDAAGQATGAGYTDATKANQYRVEARPSGGAWPALADTMASNASVLTPWTDLGADYRQAVTQANAVAFTSRGSLQNSAATLSILLQTTPGGAARTVRTNPAGQLEIL